MLYTEHVNININIKLHTNEIQSFIVYIIFKNGDRGADITHHKNVLKLLTK